MATTQRMPRKQRREQLMRVATEMFARSGYHTTSMDDVAEAAGVSKPVLYQHFSSKQDLYLAAIDTAAESFAEAIRSALAATEDNEQRVHGTYRAYLTFVSENRHEFAVLFRSDAYEPEAARKAQAARRRVANQIAELITRYTYATLEESMLLAQGVVGIAEYAAGLFVDSEGMDPRSSARLLAFMTFRGLGAMPRVDGNAPPGPEGSAAARPWDVDYPQSTTPNAQDKE
ncbi:TetR/AcrR family transcriptional regulator [Brevibacterium otitidis]|uniref:TetR/AcrR family transcriptional regulator n=1 Tax=Brevibacterium otitidis TaxID=53364 RepID=A0ABV5X437_9MICO|nr:TetR/AcrR family transcriptional regulator [Brevibacterium otitidis]